MHLKLRRGLCEAICGEHLALWNMADRAAGLDMSQAGE